MFRCDDLSIDTEVTDISTDISIDTEVTDYCPYANQGKDGEVGVLRTARIENL